VKRKQLLKDPYGADVWLLFGTTKDLNAFFHRKFDREEHIGPHVRANFCEYTPDDPKKYPLYYISLVKDRSEGRFDWAACLAHEIIHLVTAVFDKRGVQYDHSHDEAFAYYHEWIFRQCLREVW
jgi:hypothetical protein